MKQGSLFRHLFYRVALVILLTNIISSLLILPIYKDKLISMITIQGNTFAYSTLATTSEALYTKNYSFIIAYVQKVLKKTPEFEYVSFSDSEGKTLYLTAKNWSFDQLDAPEEAIILSSSSQRIEHKTYDNKQSIFVLSRKIDFSGFDWGELKLGIKDTEYQALLDSYYHNVFIISLVLFLSSLLLIKGSTLNLERQLVKLRDTAFNLSKGNLSARSSTKGVGEIAVLAKTFNSMADNLQQNTQKLQRLVRVVESTPDAIALFDRDQKIIFVNDALKKYCKKFDPYFNGMTFVDFINQLNIQYTKDIDLHSGLLLAQQKHWAADIEIDCLDEQNKYMTLRIEPLKESEHLEKKVEDGFFVVLTDITHRKQLEGELEEMAYLDQLTQLPNRRLFMERLNDAVQYAKSSQTNLAVMFLDLDNFKLINDSISHEIGDLVLKEVSHRLQSILRTDDLICRLGGDEFTAILQGIETHAAITNVAQQITQLFEQPFKVNKHELKISCSIGIVNYPDDGNTMQELTKNADTAMYAAKNSGKNTYRFFSQEMQQEMREFLDIENSLQKAIKRNEFKLVYQPIVDVVSGKVNSCEALLRWKHPERGYISPDLFIPIAEQSSLIKDIGIWVFNEACRQMQQWDFDIKVSVNVSGNELVDPNFIKRISRSLSLYDISPHKIQLEITEHVLISKDRKNLALLNELSQMGFHLALDDFGTGFSSLSYISELPIDVLKIDQSFVFKLPNDRKTIAVVNAIILLAQNLQISIIAEGCETQEQLAWLEQHACNYIQGNYYHKPMKPEALEQMFVNKNVIQLVDKRKRKI